MKALTIILACILGLLNCWCIPTTLSVLVGWVQNLVTGTGGPSTLTSASFGVLFVVMLVHSIRLAMLRETARRFQIVLLLSLPVIRLTGLPVYYLANRPIEVSRCVLPLLLFLFTIVFDVGMAYLLHSRPVREVYAGAEERRRRKHSPKDEGTVGTHGASLSDEVSS